MSAFTSGSNQRRKRFWASHVTATARPKRAMFDQPPSTSCERRRVSMSKKISFSVSGKRLAVVDIGLDRRLVLLRVVDINSLDLGVEIDGDAAHLAQADAGALRAAEGQMRLAPDGGRVDVRHAGFDAIYERKHLRGIIRVNRAR